MVPSKATCAAVGISRAYQHPCELDRTVSSSLCSSLSIASRVKYQAERDTADIALEEKCLQTRIVDHRQPCAGSTLRIGNAAQDKSETPRAIAHSVGDSALDLDQ